MYYGWIIVGIAFLAHGFITGFVTYSFGLLVVPMQTDLFASRTEIMSGISASTLLGLIYSPVFGRLVDTWSIRGLMICGVFAITAGLMLMSLSQNVLQLSVSFAVFVGAAVVLLGPLCGSSLISRWFTENRGRALGIAAIGTSVGGIVMPALIAAGISAIGWRETLQITAAVALCLLLPATLLARNYPPSIAPLESADVTAPLNLTFADIGRMPAFWWIGLSVGLLFMVYSATMTNLPAYTVGLGHSDADASRVIMVIAVCGFIGKLAFGIAADKMSQRVALWLAIGLAGAGIVLLATEPAYNIILLAAALMGFAAGGMLPVWGAMLATVFGVLSYGRVMGLMNPIIALLVMPSFILAGSIYDATGTYSVVMMIFAGLLVLSAALLVPLRIPPAVPAQH